MSNYNPIADSQQSLARLEQLAKLVGPWAHRYEQMIFDLAGRFTENKPELQISRYQGGCWDLLEIPPTEDYPNPSYWFRLNMPPEKRWYYTNDMNMSADILDSDILSMIVNLMASSLLCSAMFEAASRNEPDDRFESRYSAWNEAWHDIHHAQWAHFVARLNDRPEQLSLLLRCLD